VESLFARATSIEVVHYALATGTVVPLRRLCVRFGIASPDRLKPGSLPASYLSKPLVTFNGAAMFGELAVLRWLETDGWQGVWLDTAHGRKQWREMPTRGVPVALPAPRQLVYDRIVAANGGRASGAFDVMAWRGDQVIFVEYEGPDDPPDRNKQRWVTSAVAAGVSPNDLLFVTATPPDR
jgi:hypothetical protein